MGGPHTLRWQDVLGRLCLSITSSKTIRPASQAVALFVPALPGSPLYTMSVWRRAVRLNPAAFLSLGRLPLTPL